MNKKSYRQHTGNCTHQDFKRFTSLNKRNNQNVSDKHPVETVDSNDSTPTKLKQGHFGKNRQLNRYGSQAELKGLVFHRQNYKKNKINKQKFFGQTETDFKQLTYLPINQKKKTYGMIGSSPIFRRKTQQSARQSRNRPFQERINQQDQKNKNLQETTTSNSSTENKEKKHQHIPSFFKLKRSSQDCRSQKFSIKDFKKIKKLGQGKFGQVYLVREKSTNFIMAMKILEKQKLIKSNFMEQFIRELKVQAYLNHPNIIKLYGFFYDQHHIYVLLENGCDGQLYKLFEEKKILSEQTTSYIIKSLLKGVNYMHQNKILHRDIKPQNIVLSHGTVKICDFGWAVHNKSDLRNTYCGTPLYFSPELLKGRFYDEKVDVWAIGILAFQLHLGGSPFDICQEADLYKIITDPVKFPIKDTSTKYRQFVSAILQKNPYERLSCEKLLKLPFITYYQDLQVYSQLI